jgi:hypothetical protein
MTLIIGLSGYAQSGKTTAAEFIEQAYGVERRHIAEPLREMLAVLLRANQVPEDMIPRYLTGDLKEALIPEIGRTSRELQISLGTGWGREQVHQDLWANTWANSIRLGQKVMNDSVRFPNEELMIQGGLLGFTILIRRPGARPAAFKWGWFGRLLYQVFGCMWGVHDSERIDRLHPDFVIDNNGTLRQLHRKIAEAVDLWMFRQASNLR